MPKLRAPHPNRMAALESVRRSVRRRRSGAATGSHSSLTMKRQTKRWKRGAAPQPSRARRPRTISTTAESAEQHQRTGCPATVSAPNRSRGPPPRHRSPSIGRGTRHFVPCEEDEAALVAAAARAANLLDGCASTLRSLDQRIRPAPRSPGLAAPALYRAHLKNSSALVRLVLRRLVHRRRRWTRSARSRARASVNEVKVLALVRSARGSGGWTFRGSSDENCRRGSVSRHRPSVAADASST